MTMRTGRSARLYRPWPLFAHRTTLVGEWVAIWTLPRALWPTFERCGHCHRDLSDDPWVLVATYPSREDWIRWGMAAAHPLTGDGYCRACARRFLPACQPIPGVPLVFTSHNAFSGWPLVPLTGWKTTPHFAFGRPLRPGWRERLAWSYSRA